jgi:hypothetical protein
MITRFEASPIDEIDEAVCISHFIMQVSNVSDVTALWLLLSYVYRVVGAVNWVPHHPAHIYFPYYSLFCHKLRKLCVSIEDIGRFDDTLSYAFCRLLFFGQLTCACDSVCPRQLSCTSAFFAVSEVHDGRTGQMSHICTGTLPHLHAGHICFTRM